MIRIDMRVEHAGGGHGRDGARQSRDSFNLATFAEVWYTLDQIADCRLLIFDFQLGSVL